MPAPAAQLPDELARRAEARALIGDIHRLPERQRHVLVMSALDGLTHEEVAGRLDTTVETTRSLLARARENLRRTAAARDTDCQSVCDALDEAAVAGVRATEVARRHLWSCSDCRAYQRDLRAAPRRLRRLAAWSPWGLVAQLLGGGGAATVQKVAVGACCAIVGVGGAVAVPEIAVHSGRLPETAASVPVPVLPAPASRPERAAKSPRSSPVPVVPSAPAPSATAVARVAPGTPARAERRRAARPPKPRIARAAGLTRGEHRRMSRAMRAFWRGNPSLAEREAMLVLLRDFRNQRPGSTQRAGTLAKLQRKAYQPRATPPPPKGIGTPVPAPARPAPTATPSPAPPQPAPTAPPASPTPEPVATATPSPAPPVETATAVPTATAAL